MKYLPIITLLLISSNFSSAKGKKEVGIIVSQDSIGTSVDNTPLKCVQYLFPHNIHSYFIDSAKKEIVILSKENKKNGGVETGYLAVYDISTNTFKWEKKVFSFEMLCSRDVIILARENASYCFSRATGDLLWKKNYVHIRYILSKNGVAISTAGKGIDIKTGNELWKFDLSSKYKWDDLCLPDDTTLILASHGLHFINLKTGKTTSFQEKSEIHNYFPVVAAGLFSALAFAFSGYTGMGVISVADPNIVRGLTSQILASGDKVYFASAENLICVNSSTGKLLWKVPLRSDQSSSSSLILIKDKVILINKGIAYAGTGMMRSLGVPYIAAFNKDDGSQIYMINLNKDELINGNKLSGNTLTVLLPRAIHQYDLNTGKKNIDRTTDIKTKTYNWGYVDTAIIYERNAGKEYRKLIRQNNDFVYLIRNSNDCLTLYNSDYSNEKSVYKKDFVVSYFNSGNFNLIRDNNVTVILKNDKKVGEIMPKERVYLCNDKLFHIEADKFNVANLSQL